MSIYNIEKLYFAIFLIGSFYIISINPINIIPFSIYMALFYLPINIIIIRQKQKENIDIPDFEMGHRIIFIAIGLIPLIGLCSEPVKKILEFK
jgi:hypothetical protein